jgi:hypothetical protein
MAEGVQNGSLNSIDDIRDRMVSLDDVRRSIDTWLKDQSGYMPTDMYDESYTGYASVVQSVFDGVSALFSV